MFKQHPQGISDLLQKFLRQNSLETPLQQRRLINAWDEVAGAVITQYTEEKYIRNQTLCVKIINPALRADLQMRRSELVKELNSRVGALIITDIRIY